MTLSHVKVKNPYVELYNSLVTVKKIAKYFWTTKFILAFVIIVILFPLLFVEAKHFIASKKVKIIMNERNRIEDSLYLEADVQ